MGDRGDYADKVLEVVLKGLGAAAVTILGVGIGAGLALGIIVMWLIIWGPY